MTKWNQRIPKIRCWQFMWNASNRRSSAFRRVHVSEPYNSTEMTRALQSRIFVCKLNPVRFQMLASLPKIFEAVGRHGPYTNKIWGGSVHVLLRYRSKTTKMQIFPIDSHSNEISFPPSSARRRAPTPKTGEYTSGTRVLPHAKFGLNRPAGCREIVDKKTNKRKKNIQ